jgi:hypothetical protein
MSSAAQPRADQAVVANNPTSADEKRVTHARLLRALSRVADAYVERAFAGTLSAADAQQLTSGADLDKIATAGEDSVSEAVDEDRQLIVRSMAEDLARREAAARAAIDDPDSLHTYSESYLRRTLSLLRHVYVQRASYALFTAEFHASLAAFLRQRLRATRVLEVCCGRNLLTRPMRELGLEWHATDVRLPPAFDRAADLSGPAAAASDAAMVEAFETNDAPSSATSTTHAASIDVCGALSATRRAIAARTADVVFWSWWPPEENDEDYLVACECLEEGIPVVFVGEGRGGCTGSSMFWSGGLPICKLADVVAAAAPDGAGAAGAHDPGVVSDVASQPGAPAFADVAQWAGCEDVTWIALPPGMRLPVLAART